MFAEKSKICKKIFFMTWSNYMNVKRNERNYNDAPKWQNFTLIQAQNTYSKRKRVSNVDFILTERHTSTRKANRLNQNHWIVSISINTWNPLYLLKIYCFFDISQCDEVSIRYTTTTKKKHQDFEVLDCHQVIICAS